MAGGVQRCRGGPGHVGPEPRSPTHLLSPRRERHWGVTDTGNSETLPAWSSLPLICNINHLRCLICTKELDICSDDSCYWFEISIFIDTIFMSFMLSFRLVGFIKASLNDPWKVNFRVNNSLSKNYHGYFLSLSLKCFFYSILDSLARRMCHHLPPREGTRLMEIAGKIPNRKIDEASFPCPMEALYQQPCGDEALSIEKEKEAIIVHQYIIHIMSSRVKAKILNCYTL